MNPPKVILFNGPPRVGKDTAVTLARTDFEDAGLSAMNVKFAKELKLRTHAIVGAYVRPNVSPSGGSHLELCDRDAPRARIAPADFFEADKDKALAVFRGKTPRESYIGLSEKYFKPMYGVEIFGELLLENDITSNPTMDSFLISDSGFESEVMPLMRRYGADRIKLIRIFREGCDFSKDSRGYLDLSHHGITTIDVHNPAPLDCNDPAMMEEYRKAVAAGLMRISPIFSAYACSEPSPSSNVF
jgi:hypothetical protein